MRPTSLSSHRHWHVIDVGEEEYCASLPRLDLVSLMGNVLPFELQSILPFSTYADRLPSYGTIIVLVSSPQTNSSEDLETSATSNFSFL